MMAMKLNQKLLYWYQIYSLTGCPCPWRSPAHLFEINYLIHSRNFIASSKSGIQLQFLFCNYQPPNIYFACHISPEYSPVTKTRDESNLLIIIHSSTLLVCHSPIIYLIYRVVHNSLHCRLYISKTCHNLVWTYKHSCKSSLAKLGFIDKIFWVHCLKYLANIQLKYSYIVYHESQCITNAISDIKK